ncbi:hypothetical protein MMK73_000160 [Providencia rettgeri]
MHFVIVTEQDTQLIEQIGYALNQEWADLTPWANIALIKQRLLERSMAEKLQILSCFVNHDGQLLATASTILHELPDVQQATWWLGGSLNGTICSREKDRQPAYRSALSALSPIHKRKPLPIHS